MFPLNPEFLCKKPGTNPSNHTLCSQESAPAENPSPRADIYLSRQLLANHFGSNKMRRNARGMAWKKGMRAEG
jgi:hypothetical protein